VVAEQNALSVDFGDEVLGPLRDAVLVEDSERIVAFANDAFAGLFLGGAPAEVMLGVDCGAAARRSAEAFVEVSAWIEDTEGIVQRREPVLGQRWQMADGRWVERDYRPRFVDAVFLGHVWVYRDISDRVTAEERADALAVELEAAAARQAWSTYRTPAEETIDAVERATRRGRAVVASVKIENLDLVNAELGREASDALLDDVPERVAAAVPGAHVARVAGSAFVVVANSDPHEVVARIHDAVGVTASARGRTAMLNVVVGAAVPPEGACDGRACLQQSRVALREARRTAADVVLDPAGLAALRHRDDLGLALPGAIRDGELRLVYQPVVRLEDREVLGHEALVRWDRPGGGTIAAGSFVPAAEILGIVPVLDEWVVDRAVGECAAVLDRAGGTAVGVNISGRTLNTPGRLVPLLANAIERHGVAPERIVVEVTESAVASHSAQGLEALRDLARMGLAIAIDDFGVGSSSLSMLGHIPFTHLKLDKAFVRGLDDPRVRTLVSIAASMAADFGADVCAEGIEEEHQALTMLEQGVPIGQGWLLGMPV
jgi:EAL domain-containing protein (putative c-di-GMP-specific phosphodiesterase class I)/GGDEF domain-containing protein